MPPWLPATKHWTHKCLQRALPCLYPWFEILYLLEATDVYALVYLPCLCVTVNLTYHTQPPVASVMLSSAMFCFLSSSLSPGLWPIPSVIFFHCYKPPYPQPAKTLSPLYLFTAPLRPQMHSGHFLCGLFWQQLSEPSQPFNGWVLPGSPVFFLLLLLFGTPDLHSCSSSACIIDA